MAHSAEVIAVKGEGARLVRHDTDPCNLARDYIGVVLPHLDAAYNLARWLTRDEQNAQDVVQEAYLRAYQFFDSFHGDNARPWLLTIVRNTYYTWLKQRHDAALHTVFDEAMHSLDEAGPSFGEPFAGDPERILTQHDDRRLITHALEKLPVEFREVLILRELEDLSYKEIARIVDIPVGTVMSRLVRGRKLLEETLKKTRGVLP